LEEVKQMKMSRIHVRTLALIIGILLAPACATVGAPFQFQGTQSITVGKTTRADILSQYGKPFRVGYDNGATKWTFGYYQYKLFGDSQTKDLAITFNQSGVVSDYTYSSSEPDEVNRAVAK
jgi:hypothetical protein